MKRIPGIMAHKLVLTFHDLYLLTGYSPLPTKNFLEFFYQEFYRNIVRNIFIYFAEFEVFSSEFFQIFQVFRPGNDFSDI